MTQLLENILTASVQGSVVIAAVILLRLLLRKAPRKYISLLWLLAGLRLLLPVQVKSELSLQPILPSLSLGSFGWAKFLPWLWVAVALCFGVYSVVSYVKLKAQVREAVRIRGGWESDKIDTAFILGFIRPRIYIPMGMNRQSRKYILEHERTHLDKGDHWIKMIGFLALALHWFNPLVWVAYILLCRDIEMACDERVVQFMELEERKSYSAALLSCSSRQLHFAASPVAFGEVSVKQRILSVLNYKKPSFWAGLLAVIAIFFVILCLLTTPPTPAEAPAPVAETLSPEEQAEQALMAQCFADVQAAFAREEFFFEIYATNPNGDSQWCVKLYKLGEDTMWTYTPGNRGEITEGRMVRSGRQYAYQTGGWVETDVPDDRFGQWLEIFRWDTDTVDYLSEQTYENSREHTFTSRWQGADQTVHTATIHCSYNDAGKLLALWVDQPNYENADAVHLLFDPVEVLLDNSKTVSWFFTEAENSILKGMVTGEELEEQAEFAKWDIHFRVDDDRLSGRGSDVYFAQGEFGFGIISTTERYWLEKKVDGVWTEVPVLSTPQWSEDGLGVAKGSSTYGYLDWSPIYGELEAGKYRMGKMFECYDRESGYIREHPFYSEFEIFESVASDSPEAKAAVERCYAALEALKQRQSIHWLSVMGSDSQMEYWVNGEDYLRLSTWNGPERIPQEEWTDHDRKLFPRTDTTIRYNGVMYRDIREDPDVLSSKSLGLVVFSLDGFRDSWDASDISNDFNYGFFERSNHTITFPEGVGVISDEMVRFQTNWVIAGGMECAAHLTYKFDTNGDLCYMEYKTDLDEGRIYTSYIEIFDDTAEEIDAKIKPLTENLIVGSFSWEEARAKYTDAEFNIRQDSFINTEISPIADSVDAARRALKEYPNLGEYLSVEVSHDDTAGMWKVTIESYVDYQSTYAYRDVYIADNGVTCLLVYEGPIGWDEERK